MANSKAKFSTPPILASVSSFSPSKPVLAQLHTITGSTTCATTSALPALAAQETPALPVPMTVSSAIQLESAPPATPPLTSGS